MGKNIKLYLEWKATYTRRAYQNYGNWLLKFEKFSGKKIDDAGVGDIVGFKNWLEDNNYQPKSIELSMTILKNYFKFWRLQGKKCLSPELIRIKKTIANSYQPINFEEYCLLMAGITIDDFWDFQKLIIVRLLFETGIRVSELCDINISDIDPLRMSATIRTKKTIRMRTIFWSVETHVMLREFLIQRQKINSTPSLFIGRKGRGKPTIRLTTRSVQRIIKDLCQKAGIEKKITPHSFRHGKAHRILDLEGNPKDVQAILGHCDPSSSFTYMQWNDKEFEKRAKLFLK
ncbi:MAG: tyrosine-type recombinase/integrase [Candidatus Moraniibacteriota bacterium]